MYRIDRLVLAVLFLVWIGGNSWTVAKDNEAQVVVDFAAEVQPILARRCFSCHGPDQAESGLALHDKEAAFAEPDSGEAAIVPGDVGASSLITRITSQDEYERMPPEGKPLSEDEVSKIRAWIDSGADYPGHWAFEPLSNPAVPTLKGNPDAHPIDAFIQTKLQQAGIEKNHAADRATLIRRLYYDLIGLPPSKQQVQQFVDDPSPEAYVSLVDELLASEHYGEKWARHWLDLVRYAETNSFERDNPKPNVWKYRDYVIRSLNEDKPYDRFVREQLAGDLLDDVSKETLTATGYYRLGIWDDEPADPLQAVYDELDDLVTTTGQAFLGLTINCARCHDHKIDPIPTTDYYGMLAFFADVTPYGTRGNQVSNHQIDVSGEELNTQYQEIDESLRKVRDERRLIEQAGIVKMSAPDQRATEGSARDRKRVLRAKLDQHLTEEQRQRYGQLEEEIASLEKRRRALPAREQVLGLAKRKPIGETFVMYRGNPHSPTEKVEPHVPELFPTKAANREDRLRRLTLANWIANPNNFLTARVIVNRVWQHHFGRGIVESSNNFGMLGTPPTHPELLDYLAQRFIEGGWKFKDLHRLILTSQAYQMASDRNAPSEKVDPDNRLFWRFDPRRLSAEEIRDSILAVAGVLNEQVYGPSFYEKLSAEVLAGQSKPGYGWGDSSERDRNRRTIYIHVKRSLLPPLMTSFDFPEPDTTCEARFATLQPGQAMALLNSDFVHEKAGVAAQHIQEQLGQNGNSPSQFVAAAIEQVLARQASPADVDAGVSLITLFVEQEKLSQDAAYQLYVLSLLNWNEFVFVF